MKYNENELYHHGIKGQKWGVRRYQNADGSLTNAGKKRQNDKFEEFTNNGVTLKRNHGIAAARLLGKVNKKIGESQSKTYNYDAYANGKRIGSLQQYKTSPHEMNIVWTDVKKNERGKGYAQQIIKMGEEIARKNGAKKITAEPVGISPDALHIAYKIGYVKVGENRTQEVLDVWGGLTLVEKKL